jgi:hypothetical protein
MYPLINIFLTLFIAAHSIAVSESEKQEFFTNWSWNGLNVAKSSNRVGLSCIYAPVLIK